ncbi:MAG: hypothetical protein WDZ51_09165 [Pirellulaceae bacterium]
MRPTAAVGGAVKLKTGKADREPEVEPPKISKTRRRDDDDQFFSNPVDPNQVYAETTAAFRERKKFERKLFMGSVAVLFLAIVAGGVLVAYRYASQSDSLAIAAFEFPKITRDEIEGSWQEHTSDHLRLGFEVPGEINVQYDPETGVTKLELNDKKLGTFRVYHVPEANPFWNKWVPTIKERDAERFIPEETYLKSRTYRATSIGPIKVHRYRFAGKEGPTASQRVALIRLFSVDDQTYAVLWVGPGSRSESREVRYFFQQFALNDIPYTE